MKKARYRLPDGRIAVYEFPDETTDDQAKFAIEEDIYGTTQKKLADQSITEGMKRGLSRQLVGAKQIGSDIGRVFSGEIGQPRSEYRQRLNEEAARLNRESEQSGVGAKLGEYGLLPALEFTAAGIPLDFALASAPIRSMGPMGSIGARVGMNAGLGGLYGALEPTEFQGDRASNIAQGIATNTVLPEAIAGIGAMLRGGLGVMMPRRGAAQELKNVFGELVPERIPTDKRWETLPDIMPTAAYYAYDMPINKARIISGLEKNARNRQGVGQAFGARDVENKAVIGKPIQERAMEDAIANMKQGQLNQRTTPLREAAYEAIRQTAEPTSNVIIIPSSSNKIQGKIIPEYAQGLADYADMLRTSPGPRSSRTALKLADLTDLPLNQPGGADPADIYEFTKSLDDILRSKNPMDDLANAVKTERYHAYQMNQLADQGLDTSSRGLWSAYNKAYREGMQPITEGRAFQDILDRFTSRIPGQDYPEFTPAAFKKALQSETYQMQGNKGLVDLLSPEGRKLADESADVLDRIAFAQKGFPGTANSQTTSYLAGLLRNAIQPAASAAPGGGMSARLINWLDALGYSRAQQVLDDALLNPEKFNKLIDIMETQEKVRKYGTRPLKRGISGAVAGTQEEN